MGTFLPAPRRAHYFSFLFTVGLILTGCSKETSQGAGAPGGPGGMAPPVAVAPAVLKQIQEADEFSARLEATETVEIRPRVNGTIEKVHFREGQEVRRGDLLFSIDPRPFQAELARAEAQWAAARSQAELAKAELARVQKLLELKAVSQQEFDQLTSGLRNADANVKAADAAVASARLNVEYAQIRAPISGRVSRANVTAGNLVGNAEPILTTLVSLDKVYAYFDASEETYLKYVKAARNSKSSATTATAVQMALSNDTGFPHEGRIDFIDNRLNPQTGAIRLRAVFNNNQRQFTPGLFARVRLSGKGQYQAVLTPDRAIGTDQNRRFVFVIGADGKPESRPVQLGALVDGMRVISSGLKAGELVVVNGLQRIRPGMPVSPQKLEVDARGMPIEPAPANNAPTKAAK